MASLCSRGLRRALILFAFVIPELSRLHSGRLKRVLYDEDAHADPEGVSAVANANLKAEVEARPADFIVVPFRATGGIMSGFRKWLDRSVRNGYFGSIGGWFKEYGQEDDRSMWGDFRRDQVAAYVEEHLARGNIRVSWES